MLFGIYLLIPKKGIAPWWPSCILVSEILILGQPCALQQEATSQAPRIVGHHLLPHPGLLGSPEHLQAETVGLLLQAAELSTQ